MTLSTIMVYVDGSGDTCLNAAVDLAERFDAKLIGISAASLPWSYYAQGSTVELLEQLNADVEKRLADTEERFRRAATKRVRRLEWRSEVALPTGYVSRQARAADLIVVSRKGDDLQPDPFGHLDPGDLVMHAGRPVLVVPPKIDGIKLKCAMVAWKDTREARRAVNDSLPLLRKVQDVIVVEIIDNKSSGARSTLGSMTSLRGSMATALRRYRGLSFFLKTRILWKSYGNMARISSLPARTATRDCASGYSAALPTSS